MDGSTLWKKAPWRPSKPASDFGFLPYVFFYLGLCLEIKRVSWIESDPLLLSPGSVLLLLQQHPGEFFCSKKETQKCFLLGITLTNQVLAQQTLLFMPACTQGWTQQHRHRRLHLKAAWMDLKGSVANLGTHWDEKQLDRAPSTQTQHNQTQFPCAYIFIRKKNGKNTKTTRFKTKSCR